MSVANCKITTSGTNNDLLSRCSDMYDKGCGGRETPPKLVSFENSRTVTLLSTNFPTSCCDTYDRGWREKPPHLVSLENCKRRPLNKYMISRCSDNYDEGSEAKDPHEVSEFSDWLSDGISTPWTRIQEQIVCLQS